MKNEVKKKAKGMGCMVSRRQFLFAGSAAVATMTVMVTLPGSNTPQAATVATYPRKLIGKLSQLKNDVPVMFSYPDDGANSQSLLVKLNEEAGGGVGKSKDIVAFNAICTHQGGPLMASYKAEHKVLGACPFHLTTFDLTRHGIIVSGQAYQSLPQVMLEIKGDDIYAVGVLGLIFGRDNNLNG